MSWTPEKTLEQVERETIEQALAFFNGNKTNTAKALDISVRTLRNKITEYGLYHWKGVCEPPRARREFNY
jgi:DNA-binding NtrC family response regulator